jgi:hypothetical protein
MTAFNAQEFRAHLAQYGGIAQDNYFEVVFQLPANLTKLPGLSNAGNALTFRAHMTDMPARNLETMDRRYAGPMRNVPLGHTYTTLQLHIIEGADRATRKIMDAWQTMLMDDANGWSVPFYNDVVADYVELRLYNRSPELENPKDPRSKPLAAAVYRFYEAFPITIGASQLSWISKSQVISIPVELAYHRWENMNVEVPVYELSKPTAKFVRPLTAFDAIRLGIKNFRNAVKTVSEINSQVKLVKRQINEAKTLYRNIKNTKLPFNSLNSAAESLNKIGNLSERVVGTAERTYRSPVFTSKSSVTKLPAIF